MLLQTMSQVQNDSFEEREGQDEEVFPFPLKFHGSPGRSPGELSI